MSVIIKPIKKVVGWVGDTVTDAVDWVVDDIIDPVVDTVSKITGKDCGCNKRKDKLNELFPYNP